MTSTDLSLTPIASLWVLWNAKEITSEEAMRRIRIILWKETTTEWDKYTRLKGDYLLQSLLISTSDET